MQELRFFGRPGTGNDSGDCATRGLPVSLPGHPQGQAWVGVETSESVPDPAARGCDPDEMQDFRASSTWELSDKIVSLKVPYKLSSAGHLSWVQPCKPLMLDHL